MNKRQARIFAVGGTGLATLAFLIMTVHSHSRFGELTNADDITPAVTHGMDVWHKYNCINCHTLFGEGAYYAPDLTKITLHRGAPYLKAYMQNPSNFYDEDKHRRLMPNQNLADNEIDDLISFLDWVAHVDNQGWPPRPILVTGAQLPVTADAPPIVGGAVTPVKPSNDPRALGENLFRTASPVCTACHSLQPDVIMAGPSLAGVATRAAKVVSDEGYAGSATDAAGYLRESIVEPSAHLVPGSMFSAGGASFMPTTYPDVLTPEQIDQLVAFLGTLK